MLVLQQFMPRCITIQEAEQKWKAEKYFDLWRMQAEVSSKELQRKLEWLKMLLQGRDVQVSATVHIYIGNAYDTPLESETEK